MRKGDIKVGEVYAADGPGDSWECAKEVRVKALEGDLEPAERARTYRSTRVELLDDIEWSWWGQVKTAKAGVQYVLGNKRISHPWTEADDERVAAAKREARLRAELRERLLALGLPEGTEGPAPREDIPGFHLVRGEVHIDVEALVPWLNRIDPTFLAERAIERFVEEVVGEQPWKGLADIRADDEVQAFQQRAVAKVLSGLAPEPVA
jgi:hypothetical protein